MISRKEIPQEQIEIQIPAEPITPKIEPEAKEEAPIQKQEIQPPIQEIKEEITSVSEPHQKQEDNHTTKQEVKEDVQIPEHKHEIDQLTKEVNANETKEKLQNHEDENKELEQN